MIHLTRIDREAIGFSLDKCDCIVATKGKLVRTEEVALSEGTIGNIQYRAIRTSVSHGPTKTMLK